MKLDFGEGLDSITIQVLSGNMVDVTLLTSKGLEQKVVQPGLDALSCIGEHGSALLMRVGIGEDTQTFLLDAGGPLGSILTNMKALSVNPKKISKLIISHGHFDHFGGPVRVMEQMAPGSEIIVSPETFSKKIVLTGELAGKKIELNQTLLNQLQKER